MRPRGLLRFPGFRLALLAIGGLAIAGCASTAGRPGDAVVSVSAVNYAQLAPGGDVISVVNGSAAISPVVPAIPRSTRPVFYLILPGEIYPSDVPLAALYHQLEVSLQHRGYYSALAQVKGGRPLQFDYLLRLHYGVRPWSNPTVRADQVTWGNDGLVAKRYKTLMRSDTNFDGRQGLSADEVNQLSRLSLAMTGGAAHGTGALAGAGNAAEAKSFVQNEQVATAFGDGTQAAHDFCLVVVEAFRFADVKAMDTKAPCAWMIFIAVPSDNGQQLSALLPTMLKTAEPYYGATTRGLQVFEVPAGQVDLGEPVEVKEKPVAPDRNPAVNFR